jgi:3-oxoacyl-[acyl-carrier protein] reductase
MQQEMAIVTGGARGLGREIALTLAATGMAVAVFDKDGPAAETTAAAIIKKGGRALGMSLDVRDAVAIEATFTAAEQALGPATALVNNAGIYPDNTLLDMPEAAWDAVIDTNLKGTFLCAQRFARMRSAAGGGAIVNLASTAAFSARIGAGHYSASKAGVAMLTHSMAQEWGPLGIRVNAVAPGLIEVEGNRVTPEYKSNFLPMIPLGRTGQPPDVAAAVAFPLSDAAAFISGVVLPVDGGFLTGRPLQRSGSV